MSDIATNGAENVVDTTRSAPRPAVVLFNTVYTRKPNTALRKLEEAGIIPGFRYQFSAVALLNGAHALLERLGWLASDVSPGFFAFATASSTRASAFNNELQRAGWSLREETWDNLRVNFSDSPEEANHFATLSFDMRLLTNIIALRATYPEVKIMVISDSFQLFNSLELLQGRDVFDIEGQLTMASFDIRRDPRLPASDPLISSLDFCAQDVFGQPISAIKRGIAEYDSRISGKPPVSGAREVMVG